MAISVSCSSAKSKKPIGRKVCQKRHSGRWSPGCASCMTMRKIALSGQPGKAKKTSYFIYGSKTKTEYFHLKLIKKVIVVSRTVNCNRLHLAFPIATYSARKAIEQYFLCCSAVKGLLMGTLERTGEG